jgi:hypothetical protein
LAGDNATAKQNIQGRVGSVAESAGIKRPEAAPGGLPPVGREVGPAYGNYAREQQRRGAQSPMRSGFPGGNIPPRRPGE